jgi:protein gp37
MHMSQGSAIEWTDATWNPVAGCTPVSPGCLNCYAAVMANRLERMGQRKYVGLTVLHNDRRMFNGKITTSEAALTIPFGWKKPRRVFVNSMSDLFHEGVPFDFVDRVFAVMALCPQHTFQILTKRPERMAEYAASRREVGANGIRESINRDFTGLGDHRGGLHMPLPNVWLGTSVENQQTANERVPRLLKCPAAVRFLSCEPLLAPVDLLTPAHGIVVGGMPMVQWVIVGGESGHNARPMHPDWARSIRDQCQAAGVPFFFKQWGEWHTGADGLRDATWDSKINSGVCPCGSRIDMFTAAAGRHRMEDRCAMTAMSMYHVGKKAAGRLLDGRTWDEFPAHAEVTR